MEEKNLIMDRAIIERDFEILQDCILENVSVLDFRALNFWDFNSDSYVEFVDDDVTEFKLLSHLDPPNEFDWYAWNRLGKIHDPYEAIDIFDIVKRKNLRSSECLDKLFLTGRREGTGYPLLHMPVAISQLTWLKKLSIQGLADDIALRCISRFIPQLEYLDISFSELVTDDGIGTFLFKDAVSIKCCTEDWLNENWSEISPLVNTLEFFDFNYTGTTKISHQLMSMLPLNVYTFKRLFTILEEDLHNRFVILHHNPKFSMPIRYYDSEDTFIAVIQEYIGAKSAVEFMNFVNRHDLQTYNLALYMQKQPLNEEPLLVGIITSSKDSRVILVMIVFSQDAIISVYSSLKIDLNNLHSSCTEQCLQKLSGITAEPFYFETSKFPKLTKVDLHIESDTFLNLIRASPNLKKVRVRILSNPLESDILVLCLQNSACRNSMEELWIAPGTFKSTAKAMMSSRPNSAASTISKTSRPNSAASTKSKLSRPDSAASTKSMRSRPNSAASTKSKLSRPNSATSTASKLGKKCENNWLDYSDERLFNSDLKEGTPAKDKRIENLVQLSAKCVQNLIKICPRLHRIGNLFWWSISEIDLKKINQEILSAERKVNLIWEHLVLPNGVIFKDGKVYPTDE